MKTKHIINNNNSYYDACANASNNILLCVRIQRKEQLKEEARKATNAELKKEIQEKVKGVEEEMKYWKGQLKKWDGQINQHEKILKQATKKA